MAMASERLEPRLIAHGIASAVGEGAPSNASGMDELLDENRRLREIVIFLSEIIIRDVVGRR
jgi:hypothetical protein